MISLEFKYVSPAKKDIVISTRLGSGVRYAEEISQGNICCETDCDTKLTP